MRNNFSDLIVQNYIKEDPLVNCRSITFQVTDDCCLKCSYCYEINKGHKMMSKAIAQKGIDLLFSLYDENKDDGYINHHTKGIVLDLIGGEPFMNIETMDFIVEYFIQQCLERNHIWLTQFRVSISSNGLLYFSSAVQTFLKKYKELISLTITIDGPQELHDACRRDLEGNGSFSRAIAAWRDWNKFYNDPTTKVTIAPENLPFLNKIFDFFIDEGCKEIYANPIFEHEWTIEEAQLYYHQLKILADRLLFSPTYYSNLFEAHIGEPMPSTNNSNWCGGTGAMLAFDPDGLAYPCLRYMPSSLGTEVKPIVIGNVNSIYSTAEAQKLKEFLDGITRRSQSTDNCFNCHIASGCAWCSAENYQETGSCNKRSTHICWMHRARVLANVYYWNLYYIKNKINKIKPLYLERGIANQIISNEEYDQLLEMTMR